MYRKTQVRRAYLKVQKLPTVIQKDDHETERFVFGVAWPELRDEILRTWERDMISYGEEWPSHYIIQKVNRMDIDSESFNRINFYVTDIRSFILAVKCNFDISLLETIIHEIEFKQKLVNSSNQEAIILSDIEIVKEAIFYAKLTDLNVN